MCSNVGNGIRDLIKRLFNVGWNGEDISNVTERHLLAEINAFFIIVRSVQGTDSSNSLGTKAGTRPVGTSAIKWNPDNGSIVLSYIVRVFNVGRLEEGVDARKVWEFTTRKRGNGLVIDGRCTRQTEPDTFFQLCFKSGTRNVRFLKYRGCSK
jgi:hypothetical protein